MTTTTEPRRSFKSLVESIHSLLGLKSHLTSAWVTSVCDIVKDFPSEGPSNDCKLASENIEKTGSDEVNLGKDISKIRDELAAKMASIHLLNIQRREVLNEFLNLKGNIRVFCRVRPITKGGVFGRVVALDSSSVLLKLTECKSKRYNFDRVFHPGSSQDEVFSEVEPVIKSVLDGSNACIFAYGQTGTGKTFTMEGTPDCPGVVPRVIESLYKQAVDINNTFLIGFSMLEIYLGNLKDLLAPQSLKATHLTPPCLSIQTDPKGGIKIENLVTIQVSDFNQALRLYELGSRLRSTASTNSNKTSSRSHCMIRITFTCFDAPKRRKETNKLWMIDLGGSERVVKTKAWGRRLEEGKAINLSLSALGDVINALQRRKYHIPYRNSKLTQVLKDSLGEDSKTLMLVHVSPKEEDLCETACSLNFATRVRSTNLEHKESAEQREQKELAMTTLQQKMTWIEDECQDLRRDIKNLNDRLEILTRETPSSSELVNPSHLFTEVPDSSRENIKNGNKDLATPLQLPRFMRSTVCSRKKSGTEYQTMKEQDPAPTRRRRPSSHRAKSVTFPLKNTSEYNSEGSISRTSCLAALNMKLGEDDEKESSQETSECDIKLADLLGQEKSPQSSIHQKPHLNDSDGYGNQQGDKFNSSKFLRVDNWFHLQKNGPTTISHASRSKRILAIPTPEKKFRYTGQNKAGKLHDEKVHNDEFRKKIINHDKAEKLVDAGVDGKEIDKAPILLRDFFSMSFGSNSICTSHTIDEKIMMQTQDSVDFLPKEDIESDPFPPADLRCDGYNQDTDNNSIVFSMQLASGKTHCSDGLTSDNDCCHFSPSDTSNCIVDLIEHSGVSISIPELQSCCQEVPTNMSLNASEKEVMCTIFPDSEKRTRPCLHNLQSQGARSMENANKEDLIMPVVDSQEKMKNTGMCEILVQKMQTLYASALLGLGFQNLGYEHDFFYSLML